MTTTVDSLFAGMTHASLLRFARVVDTVMSADGITSRERCKLIVYWAYQPNLPTVFDDVAAAIKRCQGEPVHPTATSIVDAITGEVVAYNPGDQ